jgi:basic membrane protein A and related proteins
MLFAREASEGGEDMGSKRAKLFLLGAAFAVIGAACGGEVPTQAPEAGGEAEGVASDVKVGLALDIGPVHDKSFNEAANAGLQRAIEDGLIAEENAKILEANQTGSNRDENVLNLAEAGFDLIWGNGYTFSEHAAQFSADFPDQTFAVQDGFATCGKACSLPEVTTGNVIDVNFREQEGSFLVGAAAGMKTQTNTVGFLGGQEGTGLIERFQAGYEAGVEATCPDCEVLVEYIGDSVQAFVDPTKGEALSAKMYDDGADVVYHAAGLSGTGLFKAAVAAGPEALAIGVDSDQYLTASPEEQEHILTSMIKHVDVAFYDTIKAVVDGTVEGGPQVFGLAEDGVDFATSNPELLTEDIVAQLEEFRQQIIDGEITVPDEPA